MVLKNESQGQNSSSIYKKRMDRPTEKTLEAVDGSMPLILKMTSLLLSITRLFRAARACVTAVIFRAR